MPKYIISNSPKHRQKMEELQVELGLIYPKDDQENFKVDEFVKRCTTFILNFNDMAKGLIKDIISTGGDEDDEAGSDS